MEKFPPAAKVSMLTKLPFLFVVLTLICISAAYAGESPYIYGIHDTDPRPEEYLNHVKAVLPQAWVTSTMAIGHDPNDQGSFDFSWYANNGYTMICRLNNGHFPNGTIPRKSDYASFAQRCANFVRNSRGCTIWLIGNETNLAGEWPEDGGRLRFVSPQDYADCYRQCYNAIKAVAPSHKVITQGLAPFSGPFGPSSMGPFPHDGNPYSWVDYMNMMLTAIKATGGIDGIGLHVYSRGYANADIHSTYQRGIGGKTLYWSFYCYKDWMEYGIPSDMYDLPTYITECNGYYYWRGGHSENPSAHYEPGFVSEVYREIDSYNRTVAVPQGKPVIRCVNMYRWAPHFDYWNIDGDNPYKSQILSDLDTAVAAEYNWPGSFTVPDAWRDDFDDNHLDEDFPEPDWSSFSESNGRYDEMDGWLKLTGQAGQPSSVVVRNNECRMYRHFAINTKINLADVTSTTGSTSEARIRFRINKDGIGYALCFRGGSGGNISVRRTDTWDVIQGMSVDRSIPSGSTFFVRVVCDGPGIRVKVGTSDGSGDVADWDRTDSTFIYRGCFWLENRQMSDMRFDYFGYEPVGTGIAGVVRDSQGNPVAMAAVATSTGGYTALTGSDGGYLIDNVTPGTYSITASKTNFKPHSLTVTVSFGRATADFTIVDQTKPDTPVVFDGGMYQTSSDSMTISWAATDLESGISDYRYAISRSTSLGDVIPGGGWLSVGQTAIHTRTGLSLENGQTYYALVRAINGAKLASAIAYSDGIKVAKGVPGIGLAKSEPNGVLVALEDKLVTAGLSDCTYIQDLDRASGMRVETIGIPEGRLVDLAGYLSTVDGERRLSVYSITVDESIHSLSPLGFRAGTLGGAALNAYTPSLAANAGPHNTGLLVRIWGEVKSRGTGYFTISDGSRTGAKVVVPSGVTLPGIGSFVSVTGISAIENSAGHLTPVVRTRRQEDIRNLE